MSFVVFYIEIDDVNDVEYNDGVPPRRHEFRIRRHEMKIRHGVWKKSPNPSTTAIQMWHLYNWEWRIKN